MNHCAIQQNTFFACEEMTGSHSAAGRSVEKKEAVVCPKPRRLGLIHPTVNDFSYMKPLRWHASHHQESCEAKAGIELLDIILAKGGSGGGGGLGTDQPFNPIASSPPFFSGSPPSRVSNPLIQDKLFRDEALTGLPTPTTPVSGAAAPPSRKSGFIRATFGNNPTVRVEGFDCLDPDRRNCSIPALA